MRRMLLSIVVACWIGQSASGVPQGDRRGVSVIVVTTKAEAEELRDRILAGESFPLLAMRHSLGQSAADGGYIGTFRVEDLREELRVALKRSQPGGVSPVAKVGGEFLLLQWSTSEEDGWRSDYSAGLQAMQQGRYSEAVPLLSAAVAKSVPFGSRDQRVARSVLALSQTYRVQNLLDAAEPLAKQSLAIFEELYGSDHRGVIPSLENLAAIEQARGAFAHAVALYWRTLSVRWTGPPRPGHVNTADVLEKLVNVLSEGYFRDAEFEAAFRQFDETLGRATLQKDFYARVSEGLWTLALATEAEAVMRRAVLAYPDSREVRYAQGEMYARASRFEKALASFEAAIGLQGPPDTEADRQQRSIVYQQIGRMNTLLTRLDGALAAYKTALEIYPDNAESHVAVANLYLRRGKLNEAMAEYRRAISINPDSAGAYHGLADLNLHLGRFPDAASAAQRALELDPADRGSRYIQAVALLRSGRREQGQTALQEYQSQEAQALTDDRRRREISELLRSAESKLVEGRPEEALELLGKALDRQPDAHDQARLYLSLGLVQAKLGRHEQAIAILQSMIERGFGDFLVYWNLAAEYQRLGDPRFLQHRAISLQKYGAALQTRLN